MSAIQVFQPSRILSSSTTGDLLEGINQSIEAGTTNVLVNLQNVMFMDSSGLAALVIALKRVRAVHGRFALCSLNGQAKMLLEQSGMEKVFDIYDDPDTFRQAITPPVD